MRRRLIVTYVSLLAVVVVGFNVPLALTIAGHQGHELFIERQGDTAQFASLARPALDSAALNAALRTYEEETGTAVAVVAADQEPVLVSRPGLDLTGDQVVAAVNRALGGEPPRADHTVYPWDRRPLVIAEPVWREGVVIGTVVSLSETGDLRAAVLRRWAVQAGASLLVLAAGAAVAVPLARWMLRPVRRLDQAAHELAAGRFTQQALPRSGPPELQRLTESFHTMAERLTAMIERQRTFASYASHQLRTPLATLRLWVENLAPSVRPAGEADHRLVAEEIDRLSDLCDALLAYAQADAAAEDVSELDAAEVANARVAVWRQAARQAGVGLVRAGGVRTPVRVASQALDQALDALLSNAIKYVGQGNEVVVTVDTVVRADGAGVDWVDIHVIDNGPGLPAAELEQVSRPFWRSRTHQNVTGSGLGLTIADALLTASGGRLDLMPAEPCGLHARVRLPAAAPA